MTIQTHDNVYPLSQRDAPEPWTVTQGLTRREHMAALAMQGLVAHYGYGEAPAINATEIAQWSVQLADALIQELNQEASAASRPNL
ncbi:hypothetical protein [Leptolyngbya iicbica]|uniref:Uncharacterized protein n=2 Tax=Cyanophyceae TaxID=3028117 RepID=A0A4Q7E9H6_9CYAN|nr:hypothetical protein [Leptolyngbya sp. LK]RZM79507.1 hypothetical protein DYY88_12360 [Leptolyngbya sp. LK]